MDTLQEATQRLIDIVTDIRSRLTRLEVIGQFNISSSTAQPTSPVNNQIWQDPATGIWWRWWSAINRWTSPEHLFMPLGFSQVGTLVTSPNTVQVHVQQLPLNFDVYIFSLQTFWAVGATNDASNYWTVSNDFGASKTSITVDSNKEFRANLPVNQVITTRDKIRTVAGPTGYPSGLYVYGALMEYLLLK